MFHTCFFARIFCFFCAFLVFSSSLCLNDLAGGPVGCSASDVKLTLFSKLSGVRQCIPNTYANVQLRASLVCGAQERYDVGIVVAQDGGSAQTGQCYNDFLVPASKSNSDLNLTGGSGPFYNGELLDDPTDLCGDIQANQVNRKTTSSLDVLCVDTTGSGSVDLAACTTWDNSKSAGTTQKPSCKSVLDTKPSTQSKCRCQRVKIPTLFASSGNLSFPTCPSSYTLISGQLSQRTISTTQASLGSFMLLSNFQRCLQAHWSCYGSCQTNKMVCDDAVMACLESNCCVGTTGACDQVSCQDQVIPLSFPFMSSSNWSAAVNTCLCLGPGGQVSPSTPPPSGLESWPLYDVSSQVDASIDGKYAAIRLEDFASSRFIEGTGASWRTNLVKRPDIVELSSADQVLEARFFNGNSPLPSAGMIAAKGKVVNEHTIPGCARFLGGQVLLVSDVQLDNFTVYVSMVRQESPKAPVFAMSLAVALYETRGVVLPLWSPTRVSLDQNGLVGVLSFQLWSTLPRKDILHTMIIHLMELLQDPSLWAIDLDLSPLLSNQPTPDVWFSSIRHVFPGRIALSVAFSNQSAVSDNVSVKVRCWTEPNAQSHSDFTAVATLDRQQGQQDAWIVANSESSDSSGVPAVVQSVPIDLSSCIDVSVWVSSSSSSWTDHAFISQGSFFSTGLSTWTGGVSDLPSLIPTTTTTTTTVFLPGSAEVSSPVSDASNGVVRTFSVNGASVDISRFSHLHFVLAVRCSAGRRLAVTVGTVAATVTLSESNCWTVVSIALRGSDRASQMRVGEERSCFAMGGVVLSSSAEMDERNYTASQATKWCSARATVEYASDSSSALSTSAWIGVGFACAAVVAAAVVIAVIVVKRHLKKLDNPVIPPQELKEEEPHLDALM